MSKSKPDVATAFRLRREQRAADALAAERALSDRLAEALAAARNLGCRANDPYRVAEKADEVLAAYRAARMAVL